MLKTVILVSDFLFFPVKLNYMKGDKGDKKEQFNKIAELIYKTSLGLNFRFDLAKLRAKFGILPQALITDKKRNDWYATLTNEQKVDYWDSIFNFFKDHRLPVVSRWLMDHYICRDKILPFSSKASVFDTSEVDFDAIAFRGESPVEIKWKNSGQPFIRLYISDLASADDVKKVVDKNWPEIKRNLGFQWAGKRRVVRPVNDKEIHEFIYFLSLRSREMLGIKGKGYKENHIAKLVNEEYKKNYTADNIKQIIVRQRKLRKG